MLGARDIGVEIGSAALLRRVSFAVVPGEVVAIVGPNGAGKSTLLKVLSGVLAPGTGAVCLPERPLSDWPRQELARRRAVLSQKIELALPFTAMEVVLLGRAPWRAASSREQDIAVAVTAMNECGVARFAERSYTTLSGGEQQRVHLARILGQIWKPHDSASADERYLFLDEPTASLDLAHQHSTLAVARRFADGGAGVVAVLHDLNLAAMYADRLFLMKSGRAVADGTADVVLKAQLLESVFELPLTVSRHPTRGCPQVSAA